MSSRADRRIGAGALAVGAPIALIGALAAGVGLIGGGPPRLPAAEALTVAPRVGFDASSGMLSSTPVDAVPVSPGAASVQTWEWHAPTATLTVTGLVLGVIESDGVCEIRMTHGETVLVASAAGAPFDGATRCDVELTDQRLVGTSWELEFAYRNAVGSSDGEAMAVDLG